MGVLTLFLALPAQAQDAIVGLGGGVGLIDMPSARMAPDGEFSVSVAFWENSQRYTLGFQALPWFETSFRYTGLTRFSPDFPVFYDRAFAMKVRLWEEAGLWPSIAVGTNDLLGTGVYSSEYIVASKQVGPVDVTLGLGWGRLATANTIRNPFSLISSSFDNRETADLTQGGNFSFTRYFRGREAGIFGGVSWKTPLEGLTLVAEYSSDKYVRETGSGNFAPTSQINLGASYRIWDRVSLGMGWIYGQSVYGSLSLNLDPTEDPFPQRLGPPLPPPNIRNEDEQRRALQDVRDRRDHGPSIAVDDALTDVLWRHADVQDVTISGQTLGIRVTQPAGNLCATLARALAPYAGDINRLSVNGTTQCPIINQASLRPTPQRNASYAPMILAADLQTIDATGPARPTRTQAQANIRRLVQEQNVRLRALSLTDNEALIYYENNSYSTEAELIDRLLRILMAEAPGEIEVFRLTPVVSDIPQAQIVIPRGTAERAFAQQGTYNIFRDQGLYRPAPMRNPVLDQAERGTYPRFGWSIFPQFRQQLFDPDNPFGVQLLVGANATVNLLPGLRVTAEVEGNIANTFEVGRISDSVLPHVRTDFVNYFSQGKNGIGLLEVEQTFRLSPVTHVALRAGYLESMFAGIGGEVLWQPEGQRWALGWDLFYVKQRDFNRLFGFQNYSQTTGHMTFYYAMPWQNLDLKLRIGRYLAGDWGATFQMTRRFASGIEIGVFATKTNVTAAQFGEGSFDKGIIIRLPLSHLMPVHTQQSFGMDLRPIQRDGGQILAGDARLYDRLLRASEAELRRTSLD